MPSQNTKRVQVPRPVRQSVKTIAKTLNEGLSVYAYPVSIKKTKDIPPEIHAWLDNFLKTHPDTEVFGSLAMQSYAPHGRAPGDLDAVVDNPEHIARTIASKLKSHGYSAKAYPHPWKGGWQVAYKHKKTGEDIIVADLHAKGGHNVRFTEYGYSKKPSRVHGMLIQEAEDQMLRKANSIVSKGGIGSHRAAKDLEDFIVIAMTLLDSKELRAQAKLAKVQQAKRELKKVIEYAGQIQGTNKKRMTADPIPDTLEKKVISYAKSNPDVDVRDIVILPNKIAHTTRVPKRNPPEQAKRYPHVDDKTGGRPQSQSRLMGNPVMFGIKTPAKRPRIFSWKV